MLVRKPGVGFRNVAFCKDPSQTAAIKEASKSTVPLWYALCDSRVGDDLGISQHGVAAYQVGVRD